MRRDFTYVDDIVEGVVRVARRAARGAAPGPRRYAIYNIGNHEAVELETFIATLERLLGRDGDPRLPADAAGRRAGDLRVDRPAARRRPASRRARRSPTASRASSPGIATITATDRAATVGAARARSSHLIRAGPASRRPRSRHTRIPMILVTGGAGFIGANFVLDWLAAHRRAGRQSRQAHLRRQPRQPRSLARRRAPRLRARRHRRPRAGRRAAARAPAARDRQLRRREPRRPLDPRPGGVRRRPTSSAPSRCSKRRALLAALPGAERAAFRFLHVSTDEVYGSLGPRRSRRSPRPRPTRRTAPTRRRRPASDHLVRAYHHTYGLPTLTTNCSNNYGPHQFPEKLIPLMIVNALAGKPLPVYGDGQQRARLALRRRPLRGDPRGARRAGVPARPTTSAATPR